MYTIRMKTAKSTTGGSSPTNIKMTGFTFTKGCINDAIIIQTITIIKNLQAFFGIVVWIIPYQTS